jgi:ATP-dependent DNA helicase RecG
MSVLPIPLSDLISGTTVESSRCEYKKTWNDPIREAAIRTICAFANDFQNLNGGYILIGIEDKEGKPILPPHGLDGLNLDRIQKEIRGQCERIDPKYQPIIAPETYMGKQLIVLSVPPGDVRPYSAPEHGGKGASREYYVRVGSETLVAKGELLTQLMQLAARVPFDDRRSNAIPTTAISADLVNSFLADIHSGLLPVSGANLLIDVLRSLRLVVKTNGSELPRNVALMFFTNDPELYFPGARIEVVQFGDDTGGDLIEEKSFRGPLSQQIRQVLNYLNGLSTSVIRKIPGQAESHHFVAFPYEAMEEAISNAVLHRSYESPPEPIKVYLYPNRLEITSYPGPVPGVELKDFLPDAKPPQAPMRNRRIGDFLKELRLAEMRGTGVPTIRRKMQENGSPQPSFDFDVSRTYFRVTLPAHPEYIVVHALREAAQLWATGDRERAINHLEQARTNAVSSGALVAQLIEYIAASASDDLSRAHAVFAEAQSDASLAGKQAVYLAMARALLDRQKVSEARAILAKAPRPIATHDTLELAILQKRSGQAEEAHRTFASGYQELQGNAKAVHEFAQTKMQLAGRVRPGRHSRSAREKLNREALELLHRVVQLADSPTRTAWAWFDIARTLAWLNAPETEIQAACSRAIELIPEEQRFKVWIADHNERKSRHSRRK